MPTLKIKIDDHVHVDTDLAGLHSQWSFSLLATVKGLEKMAYIIEKKISNSNNLAYLPEEIILSKTNEKVSLDFYRDSDKETIYKMFSQVVEEGLTYPHESAEREHFENYYLSHEVFVVRDDTNQEVLGSFYIKPNFPGRSSHICNAGFLVNTAHRQKGIGEVMFKKYLRIARDLGYEGSFFNLVYATNTGSVKICRKLGFQEIGRVPKAGKMKGLGDVDALQFYYDLTSLDDKDL